MDHIWNSLKQWEDIWMEELEEERHAAEHEHKQHNIDLLTRQLNGIRKALKEISKVM